MSKKDREKIRKNYIKNKCRWLSNITVVTFHGFCSSILRTYGESVFDSKFKILNTQKTTYTLQSNEEILRDESDDFVGSEDRASELVKAIFKAIIHTAITDPVKKKDFEKYLDDNFADKSDIRYPTPLSRYPKALDKFINYLIKVIDLFKVEDKNYEEIIKKGASSKYEKVRKFYEYLDEIYPPYSAYCINKSYLDFNDLHIKTLELFAKDKKILHIIKNKYRHILVDEFQDVNTLQMKLLKYVETPQTRMFCVGDDWQSIYGWRGSKVDFILNFSKWFDDPKTIRLEINYRCGPAIVNLSNNFIRNNAHVLDKNMRSNNSEGIKVRVYRSKSESSDGYQQIIDKIKQLNNAGYKEEDILVLYRFYRGIIDPYLPRLRRMFESGELHGRILTAHRAKGLEARAVFIIGVVNRAFPRNPTTDPVLEIIEHTDFENEEDEERRLFYVSMTRARQDLFIITEEFNESRYLRELSDEYLDFDQFMQLDGPTYSDYKAIEKAKAEAVAQQKAEKEKTKLAAKAAADAAAAKAAADAAAKVQPNEPPDEIARSAKIKKLLFYSVIAIAIFLFGLGFILSNQPSEQSAIDGNKLLNNSTVHPPVDVETQTAADAAAKVQAEANAKVQADAAAKAQAEADAKAAADAAAAKAAADAAAKAQAEAAAKAAADAAAAKEAARTTYVSITPGQTDVTEIGQYVKMQIFLNDIAPYNGMSANGYTAYSASAQAWQSYAILLVGDKSDLSGPWGYPSPSGTQGMFEVYGEITAMPPELEQQYRERYAAANPMNPSPVPGFPGPTLATLWHKHAVIVHKTAAS